MSNKIKDYDEKYHGNCEIDLFGLNDDFYSGYFYNFYIDNIPKIWLFTKPNWLVRLVVWVFLGWKWKDAKKK